MTHIVAGIDGSALSQHVADAAVWAEQRTQHPVLLLHSLEKNAQSQSDDLSGSIGFSSREHLLQQLTALDEQRAKIAMENGRFVLDSAKEQVLTQGVQSVNTMQRHGELVDNLIELEKDAALIVLGRSGTGHALSAKTIGSHIEHAVRALHTPILITVGPFTPPKQVMIAYDGREAANNAIAKIAQSTLLKGLRCHLVTVGDPSDTKRNEQLAQASQILQHQGFDTETHIINGDIYNALIEYKNANDIDLMVMGAYAHSKVRQFFVGSNTNKMIIESDIPLLILR